MLKQLLIIFQQNIRNLKYDLQAYIFIKKHEEELKISKCNKP